MGACASKKKSRMSVEERIEHSRLHWSILTQPTEGLFVEEVALIKRDNEEVFRAWQSHREWGFFFVTCDDFEEFKVGEKFAEGAQAEIYHVHLRSWNIKANEYYMKHGFKWVLKVFREGTSLQDLQCQWPHGLFQLKLGVMNHYKLGNPPRDRTRSDVSCAILLRDGRFAFLIQKEDEDLRSLIDRKMLGKGHSGGGPFSKVEAEEYMCDVALGLDDLHRYNIVHRDLKASNVLVYRNGRRTHTFCVVSDYECSIGVVGTRYFRAPEILRACKDANWQDKPELFSKAADIYSLGMTFYEILIGKQPFQDESVTMDLVIEGRQPCVPGFVDEWARQLLHQCWQQDHGARPSIEDILGILEANSSSEYIKFSIAKRLERLREEETLANN